MLDLARILVSFCSFCLQQTRPKFPNDFYAGQLRTPDRPLMRVIARNSSFVYKGRSVDVREAAKQLGVRYVLEGSVRKSGNHPDYGAVD
jgi:hypothetical protein